MRAKEKKKDVTNTTSENYKWQKEIRNLNYA